MKTAFWTWAAVWPLSMGAGGIVRAELAGWPAWLQAAVTSALIVAGLKWVVRPLAAGVLAATRRGGWFFPSPPGWGLTVMERPPGSE